MPIYAYRCESCGHAQDVLQKLSDAPLTDCPACGQPALRKQVTAAGFQLKGSGWYVTDFRDKGQGKAAKKPEGEAKAPEASSSASESSAAAGSPASGASSPASGASGTAASGTSSSGTSSSGTSSAATGTGAGSGAAKVA